MTAAAFTELRGRLVRLRDDALAQLADRDVPDPGMLALVSYVTATLATIDAMPPAGAESAARVVVADDGVEIRLASYSPEGLVVTVPIEPIRAAALASDLIATALRHFTMPSADRNQIGRSD